MKMIIGTGIGFLLCIMNANAVELGADHKSGATNAAVDFVLELSGIDYSYPATVLEGGNSKGGSRSNSDVAPGFDHDTDLTLVGRYQDADKFRLTAGMIDVSLSENATGKRGGEASVEKPVPYSNDERIAVRDGRFKLAVGVGTTSLESDIVLDARPDAGSSNDVDYAELAALLNEVETETTVDLEDYFERPVLAIGVNYAF